MIEKKEYRSAIRSRKLIRQAFLELLKEKNFEKITVTDIVKRADINRSTFYAHYPDVMGVLDEIQEEVLGYVEQLMAELDFSNFFENPLPLLQKIVKLTEENNELYRFLMNSSMAVKQLQNVKILLIDKILNTYDSLKINVDYFKFEFLVRFFMGGVVDIYIQWLNGGMDCSLDEITEQLAGLIKRVSVDFR